MKPMCHVCDRNSKILLFAKRRYWCLPCLREYGPAVYAGIEAEMTEYRDCLAIRDRLHAEVTGGEA